MAEKRHIQRCVFEALRVPFPKKIAQGTRNMFVVFRTFAG
jgi:hypothetical protein